MDTIWTNSVKTVESFKKLALKFEFFLRKKETEHLNWFDFISQFNVFVTV